MRNKHKIYIALVIAFVIAVVGFGVFNPKPTGQVVFSEPQAIIDQDRCVPTGAGVLQTAQLMINEIVHPECK